MAFVRALRECGHEITIHAFSQYDNQPPFDIPLMVHEGGGYGILKAKRYLAALLKEVESNADLFFLYGTDLTWGGGDYRKSGGKKPVVVYLDTYLASMGLMHDDVLSRMSEVRYTLKRYIWDKVFGLGYVRHVDKFLAVSPYVMDVYTQFGFPRDKFAVIPNFFDLPIEVSPRGQTETVNLLYTGRFTYDKGTDLLLESLSHITEFSWHLRMVGDGSQKDLCRAMIEKYKFGSRVEMIHWIDPQALQQEYARADIFIHPARWPEPFGRTVVEAMGYGLPVIVPRQGAAAWIAGDAGLTFENGNKKGLRAAIEKLSKDPSLRAQLGQKGRERAQQFAKDKIVPQLEDVLQGLCTGHPRV
jgi:glycosyltransferase involved in cell wall biosynthesis